jgi:predicted small metal-binding protein
MRIPLSLTKRRPLRLKAFACAALVPGCPAEFTGETEHEILIAVAEHARREHDMRVISAEFVSRVRRQVYEVR